MQADLWHLYALMMKSRLFEVAVSRLWDEGLISGEMHAGTGEEAIIAGVVSHLKDGDALALDHRGTAPLVMRGVDLVALLREFLAHPDGLCAGMGGHMHLFSEEILAASSGIVGASAPAAVGFALAAQHLRPRRLAIAFFGEGATNQGMLLEALNLAVIWKLPVLFVCKDNEWAISTHSPSVTGHNLVDRVRGFGMQAVKVDGLDVEAMWMAARDAIERARIGGGPTFLLARCVHIDGHFLGDPLLRLARSPLKEMPSLAGPLLKAVSRVRGAALPQRLESLKTVATTSQWLAKSQTSAKDDPLRRARKALELDLERLTALEDSISHEIEQVVELALVPPREMEEQSA
jgi:TPP-dependent pyruvate/acetoin dehydrogenase alpha subunit